MKNEERNRQRSAGLCSHQTLGVLQSTLAKEIMSRVSFSSSYKLSQSHIYKRKKKGIDDMCHVNVVCLHSSPVAPIVLEQLVLAGLAEGGAGAQAGAQ